MEQTNEMAFTDKTTLLAEALKATVAKYGKRQAIAALVYAIIRNDFDHFTNGDDATIDYRDELKNNVDSNDVRYIVSELTGVDIINEEDNFMIMDICEELIDNGIAEKEEIEDEYFDEEDDLNEEDLDQLFNSEIEDFEDEDKKKEEALEQEKEEQRELQEELDKRIFTDEERIDEDYKYLSVDAAKNLGYLDESLVMKSPEEKVHDKAEKQRLQELERIANIEPIFTDESRIDKEHNYLTASNAKNLNYLGEIPEIEKGKGKKSLKGAKSLEESTNDAVEFYNDVIDLSIDAILDNMPEAINNARNMASSVTNSIKNKTAKFSRKKKENPEYDELDYYDGIYENGTIEYNLEKTANEIVAAMENNQIDVDGNLISSELENNHDRHIA